MVPIIEVSHLPSSASFYAAITQPLGIHYLSATTLPDGSSPPNITFGFPGDGPDTPPNPVFTLSTTQEPKPSHVILCASSSAVVTEFHKSALQANPLLSTHVISHTSSQSIAKTTDLDNNMLEARYVREAPPPPRRSSAPTITTASTAKEAKRVLDWQRDVARSISEATPPASRDQSQERQPEIPLSAPAPQMPRPQIIRRETIATSHYHPEQSTELVTGMSNQALIGTILGAAAGAAVAYAMVRSEEPADKAKVTTYATSRPVLSRMIEVEKIIEAIPGIDVIPAKSRVSTVASSREERPRAIVRYNTTSESEATRREHQERDKKYLDTIEEPRTIHIRTRDSEAGSPRSQTGSKGGGSSSSKRASPRPHSTLASSEKKHSEVGSRTYDTYVSAKTSGSTTTVKPKSKSSGSTSKPSHVKSGASGRDREERDSGVERRSSTHGARLVPLPESVAGSVAPSDSISNVGSGSTRRERERRRERY